MEKISLKETLDELILTKIEAEIFLEMVDETIDSLYLKEFEIESVLKRIFPRRFADAIITDMSEKFVNKQEKNLLNQYFQELRLLVINRPIMSLTLAFDPKDETLTQITKWCKKSLNISPILEFIIDKEIIAGCLLSVKGIYKDYSVKKAFIESQSKIMGLFSSHA